MKIAIAGNTSAAYYCLEKLCRANFDVVSVFVPDKNIIQSNHTADFNSLSGEFDFEQIIVSSGKTTDNNYKIDLLIKLEWPNELSIPIVPSIGILGSNLEGQYKEDCLTDIAANIYKGDSKFECQITLESMDELNVNTASLASNRTLPKILDSYQVEINLFDDVHSAKIKVVAHYYMHLIEMLKIIQADKTMPTIIEKDYYRNSIRTEKIINWNESTKIIYNHVRSLTHYGDSAFTYYDNEIIKIWRGHPFESNNGNNEKNKPGSIVDIFNDIGVLVKTGDGVFLITRLQFSGAPELPSWVWAENFHVKPFEMFGDLKKDEIVLEHDK
jgi:hypothetical protein